MKIFIIAALTADGFIAKNSAHGASWTSKADKEFFKEATKRAGVVVMGSKTYETIGKPLPGRRTIVLSRSKKFEGIEMSSETPRELAARLENEGLRELAVCGGSAVYTEFMESGLVDALYLTIEPVMFGAGIGLFNKNLDVSLELVSSRPLEGGAVLLEYRLKK